MKHLLQWTAALALAMMVLLTTFAISCLLQPDDAPMAVMEPHYTTMPTEEPIPAAPADIRGPPTVVGLPPTPVEAEPPQRGRVQDDTGSSAPTSECPEGEVVYEGVCVSQGSAEALATPAPEPPPDPACDVQATNPIVEEVVAHTGSQVQRVEAQVEVLDVKLEAIAAVLEESPDIKVLLTKEDREDLRRAIVPPTQVPEFE